MHPRTETAIFALGNFWEPEYEFAKLNGVSDVETGYAGGTSAGPSYHDIGDHSEAIQVNFDPYVVSYEVLLEMFWKLHDPTAPCEPKFRSHIFYLDQTQQKLAEASKLEIQTGYNLPVLTEILPAGKFFAAESYHQHYLARLRGEL